MKMEE